MCLRLTRVHILSDDDVIVLVARTRNASPPPSPPLWHPCKRFLGVQTCDDQTGYPFPCFDDPEEELPDASGMAPGAKLSFFDM